MELKDSYFSESELISLNGTWEFYWNQFTGPKTLPDQAPAYISVPGSWTALQKDGMSYSANGFATYRVLIKTARARHYWGIKVFDICTASRIFVNGELMATAGNPAKSQAENIPLFLPLSLNFYSESPDIEIIIHVSNYYLHRGGLWKEIVFGTAKAVNQFQNAQVGFDLLVFGALLSMSIYHLVLYLLGKKDGETLFFGLFCLLMACRTLITGQRFLISQFPESSWFLMHRLELISIYLGLGIYSGFLKNLFPQETNRSINRVIFFFCIGYSVFTLLLPPTWFDSSFRVFIFLLISMCSYTIFINIKAIINKRVGSPILFIGSLILVASIINDVLYSQLLIQSMYFTPLGFIIFIICSEFTFNIRYILAEKELKKSEEKNKALLEAYPDTILLLDKYTKKILEYKINFNLLALLGSLDLKQKSLDEVFPDYFSAPLLEALALKNINQKAIEIQHTNKIQHYYEARLVENQDKILIIIRNITDKKNIEKKLALQKEQLIQADKLASLGTLVAGVAHEINNPNTSILLSSEIHKEAWTWVFNVIEEEFSTDIPLSIGNMHYDEFKNEMEKSFERIVRNSKRIKTIVEELKAFSRKEIGSATEIIDLNQVILNSIAQIQQIINKHTHHFTTELDSDLPGYNADASRLEQVFTNIIKNACHALEDTSKAIIITSKYIKESNEIHIEIIDQGIGMDEDTIQKITDPFFTTKRLDGGLGLGLSISNKIIKDHGGQIEFISKPGDGTRVRIVFSLSEGEKK
ncbi:MAG: hypothetical protein JXR70_08330 [Spirochaetales bacterium]|nr:hypothetical protein [Spirochaetales bacterium]